MQPYAHSWECQEFTQRLLMRIRVEFKDCYKFTIASDKSKVGKELMSLVYLYALEKHAGSMLPPQAIILACRGHRDHTTLRRISKLIGRGCSPLCSSNVCVMSLGFPGPCTSLNPVLWGALYVWLKCLPAPPFSPCACCALSLRMFCSRPGPPLLCGVSCKVVELLWV